MPARKPPARTRRPRSRQDRAVWAGAGLVTAMRALWDRRLLETVITWVVGLVALTHLARDNQKHAIARLTAWDRRATERYRRGTRRGTRR